MDIFNLAYIFFNLAYIYHIPQGRIYFSSSRKEHIFNFNSEVGNVYAWKHKSLCPFSRFNTPEVYKLDIVHNKLRAFAYLSYSNSASNSALLLWNDHIFDLSPFYFLLKSWYDKCYHLSLQLHLSHPLHFELPEKKLLNFSVFSDCNVTHSMLFVNISWKSGEI